MKKILNLIIYFFVITIIMFTSNIVNAKELECKYSIKTAEGFIIMLLRWRGTIYK